MSDGNVFDSFFQGTLGTTDIFATSVDTAVVSGDLRVGGTSHLGAVELLPVGTKKRKLLGTDDSALVQPVSATDPLEYQFGTGALRIAPSSVTGQVLETIGSDVKWVDLPAMTTITTAPPFTIQSGASGPVTVAFPNGSVAGRVLTEVSGGQPTFSALPAPTSITTAPPFTTQSGATGSVTVAFPNGSVAGRVLTEVSGGQPTFQTPGSAPVTTVSAAASPNGIIVTPTTGNVTVAVSTTADMKLNSVGANRAEVDMWKPFTAGAYAPLYVQMGSLGYGVSFTTSGGTVVAQVSGSGALISSLLSGTGSRVVTSNSYGALTNDTTISGANTWSGLQTFDSVKVTGTSPPIHRVPTYSSLTQDCPLSRILLSASSSATWTSVTAGGSFYVYWGWREAVETGYTNITIELDIESSDLQFWVDRIYPMVYYTPTGVGPGLAPTSSYITDYLYTYFNRGSGTFGQGGGQNGSTDYMEKCIFAARNAYGCSKWTIRIPFVVGNSYNAFYYDGHVREANNHYDMSNIVYTTGISSSYCIAGLQFMVITYGCRYRYRVWGDRTTM